MLATDVYTDILLLTFIFRKESNSTLTEFVDSHFVQNYNVWTVMLILPCTEEANVAIHVFVLYWFLFHAFYNLK